MINHTIKLALQTLITSITQQELEEQVEVINFIKQQLHSISPMKFEPVDCVLWVKNDMVQANDYNPNSVAPPEMQLLEISILEDGYTQPVVTYSEADNRTVVDGFHRTRVAKESKQIIERVHGYVPVVTINEHKTGKNDRIASTIRHNRARGKHQVNAMSDIVLELKNRNWTNDRISRELGMDKDEILRLCQITGLEGLFKDEEFSKSWLIEDSALDFEELTDEISDEEREANNFRTVNTSDEQRIFHTYDKWECFKSGFYDSVKDGMTKEQCEQEYHSLLTDIHAFAIVLDKVISEWKFSCEHYLTNKSMNRIAYLGQAALCYAKGIPSTFRGGWNLLTPYQQEQANETALGYLNKWLLANNLPVADIDEAAMTDKQVNIY